RRRVLGRGASAKVYHARHVPSGHTVAIRVFPNPRHSADSFICEISALHRLCHPHTVCLHEVLASHSNVYLVLELAKGGELISRVQDRDCLQDDLCRRLFRRLVSAVAYSPSAASSTGTSSLRTSFSTTAGRRRSWPRRSSCRGRGSRGTTVPRRTYGPVESSSSCSTPDPSPSTTTTSRLSTARSTEATTAAPAGHPPTSAASSPASSIPTPPPASPSTASSATPGSPGASTPTSWRLW
ncbi:CBL-interacting serine threonine-protein kinase 11, partial [Musa troglodytarum]